MKTNPSHYVLALEIIAIALFHAVKIRNAEKHPSDIVYNSPAKYIQQPKPVVDNTNRAEYILLNLVK
jgi:hypothetical protein